LALAQRQVGEVAAGGDVLFVVEVGVHRGFEDRDGAGLRHCRGAAGAVGRELLEFFEALFDVGAAHPGDEIGEAETEVRSDINGGEAGGVVEDEEFFLIGRGDGVEGGRGRRSGSVLLWQSGRGGGWGP
jgi:hypothetical protein